MSLVNQETLKRLKEERTNASRLYTDAGYQVAMRALDAAIAQLEQLSLLTAELEVTVVQKG